MSYGTVKTWDIADIEAALKRAEGDCCPQCFPDTSELKQAGAWRVSVGPSDVIVTAPGKCARHEHDVVLQASLWSPAYTPLAPYRGRKHEASAIKRARPLQEI